MQLGIGVSSANCMPDLLNGQQRSSIMAAIKSKKNRSTEIKLVTIMRIWRITGWRRDQALMGKPDFVFRRERVAVFVDGCFWHGCRWHCRMPRSHTEYWQPKIANNRLRDRTVRLHLAKQGWRVHRIWEHELKKPELVAKKLQMALARARPVQ